LCCPGRERGKVSVDQNSAIKERKSRRRRHRFSKYGIKPWCTAGGFLFFMWPTGCTFYGAPHAIYEASAGENTNYHHTQRRFKVIDAHRNACYILRNLLSEPFHHFEFVEVGIQNKI
jgi:hypothetical protein